MKFLHLSDLHIGKRVNEFSMLEDQEYILMKIINIVDEQKPDCVFIAGDIYDKSIPPAEAVQLFNDFLTKLSDRNLKVFVISGNHDSAERIAFGSHLMNRSGVFMSPVFEETVDPIIISDSLGEINIYMLPFIKPAHVKRYYENEDIDSYNKALKTVIDNLSVDITKRNILIAHQFITGAECSESEDISIGGLDNVDATVFDPFDYVALGHIHRPQKVYRDTIRYSGTPLKYSFSEATHKKSVTMVELNEKGNIKIDTIPLIPKRDIREIKGTYAEITKRDHYIDTSTNDYMHITLTDEEDIPDAIGKLRSIYPNIMKIDYDNKRTRSNSMVDCTENVTNKSPLELFSELYFIQNNQDMSDQQRTFTSEMIEKIWEVQK